MSEEELKAATTKTAKRGRKKKIEEEQKINGLIDLDGLTAALGELEKESMIKPDQALALLAESMEQAYLEWTYPGLFRDRNSSDPDSELVKSLVRAKVVFSDNYKRFEIFDVKTVTDEDDITDDSYQVSVEDAQKFNADAKVGDVVDLPFDITLLNKAYVRRVKQLLMAKLKDASKAAILDVYRDKIGHLIEGTVTQIDEQHKSYELNFGKSSGQLRARDLIPDDNFTVGEKVKVYLKDVSDKDQPAGLVITRADERFVKALMEDAVPEIADGEIKIRAISREAGSRTKVFVESLNPNIDPIGTCVGPDSARIREVTSNLHKEKIDVLVYRKNKALQVLEAMKPATIIGLACPEDFFDATKDFPAIENDPEYEYPKVTCVVTNGSQGIAIGSKGVNVRLASRITHCTVSVLQADEAIAQSLKYLSVAEVEAKAGEMTAVVKEAKPLSEEEKDIIAQAEDDVAAELGEDKPAETEGVRTEEVRADVAPEPVKEEVKVEAPKKEEAPIEHIEIKNKPKFDIADIEAALGKKKGPAETRSRKRFKKDEDTRKTESKPSLAAQQEAMPIYSQEELEQMNQEDQDTVEDSGSYDDLDIDEEYDDDKYYNN